MVPNNAHRVLQFHISFDFVIIATIVLIAAIGFTALYIADITMKNQDMQEIISQQEVAVSELEDQTTVLQAEIEDMEASLHEAKVTIDANKNLKQQEEEKQTEETKPTSLPVDNASALPSEYTEEKQYVEFTTGMGTRVLATADGVVKSIVQEADHPELGYIVTVDHGNSYSSVYMMPILPQVNEGDKVARGTTLFTVDQDNLKLAYKIMINDIPVDPMEVMKIDG